MRATTQPPGQVSNMERASVRFIYAASLQARYRPLLSPSLGAKAHQAWFPVYVPHMAAVG